MLKTVHLFYPSFEKGGATKNLLRIVNFLLKKKIKVFLFSRGAKKNNFIKNKNLTKDELYMSGADVFTFTMSMVPKSVNNLLNKSNNVL